ncbi:MAG: hypothetical protein ACE5K4_10820 [Candidatus Hydrothermarchaeota archaeon]
MAKRVILLLFLVIQPVLAKYDVVIVNNDIATDRIIAESYAQKEKIPLITLTESLSRQFEEELKGYSDFGWRKVLIIGGTTAVTKEVESFLESQGFAVTRIWDWDRTGTAARAAIDLWGKSEEVVLVNGDDSSSILVAGRYAITKNCPLLLTESGRLTPTTEIALDKLEVKKAYLVGPNFLKETVDAINSKEIEIVRVGENIEKSPAITIPRTSFSGKQFILPTIFLVIGMVLGFVLRPKRRDIMDVFTEEEKIIIQKIKEAEGQLKQEDLPTITKMSRPKVSRLVTSLEERGIILKEREGKSYKLKLKKNLF